jgi:hypothetical protein
MSGFTSLVSTAEAGGISLETKSKRWAIDVYTADVRNWHKGVLTGVGVWQQDYSGALSNQPVKLGQWQHIAGVWDGKELRLYVDGVLHDRHAGVNVCTRISHGPFLLGAEPCNFEIPAFEDGALNGRMRAARISRAAEYDESFPLKESLEKTPGTIGLYDFTRDSGRIAIDWSGHGNHGIIVGAKFAEQGTSP